VDPDRLLGMIDAGRLLDVATGDGSFLDYLLPRLQGVGSIVGVDSDSTRRSEFEARFDARPGVSFRTMDARRLAFRRASFGMVTIAHSLCQFAAPKAVLVEMLNILRPGGHLVVAETYRDQVSEPEMTFVLLHDWWSDVDATENGPHQRFRSRAELEGLVRSLDLDDVQLFDVPDDSEGPFEPELHATLDALTDRLLDRVRDVPELVERGHSLRRRMQEVGCARPTAVLAVGRRPRVIREAGGCRRPPIIRRVVPRPGLEPG
jgi:SAM-dependent methyltransferase